MGFSQKRRFVRHLGADIAVVPECSRASTESPNGDGFDCLWFGENPRKGLGVLVAKPWRIVEYREPKSRWVAPIWISGPFDFLLLAVWTAKITESNRKSYVGQVCDALECHPEWFNGQPLVMCGDFNSNAIWDERREKNHSWLVRFLEDRQTVSAYHHHYGEPQGKETRPTHYFYHHQNRGFHIDHIFLPKAWAQRIKQFEVGSYEDWAKVSDHVPLVVDVNLDMS
jgi:exonuclease III